MTSGIMRYEEFMNEFKPTAVAGIDHAKVGEIYGRTRRAVSYQVFVIGFLAEECGFRTDFDFNTGRIQLREPYRRTVLPNGLEKFEQWDYPNDFAAIEAAIDRDRRAQSEKTLGAAPVSQV